jgi:predicted Fe-Mo cluster-binding NifX family protein
MKIAVPTKEDNGIDDHFGHCEFYTIFTISEDNEIIAETKLESPQGCGCKSNIAYDLAKLGVKVMLAGGIGEGAINKLASQNIQVIRNCKGDVHELTKAYLAGNLKDGGASCAAHGQGGEDGHVCNH